MSVLTAADLELESVEMLPARETLHGWRRPGNSFTYTSVTQSQSADGGNNNPGINVSPGINVLNFGHSSATGGDGGYGGGNGGVNLLR